MTARPAWMAVARHLPALALVAAAGPPSPENIAAVLDGAKGGQRIVLPAGDYGRVVFPKRDFQPKLTIDARAARFTALVLENLSGVEVIGGRVEGAGGKSYGVTVTYARDLTLRDMTITGAHRGMVMGASQDVVVANNLFTGLISDGLDIANSQRIVVRGNTCRDFAPAPAVYDAAGGRLRDGDHADCIQAWSRPHGTPTGDLLIENNVMEGRMQGIFLGNHVRNGVDDGGFDRIRIRNNRITVSSPNGIRIISVRGGEIVGNVVRTVPGSMQAKRPTVPMRANLSFVGSGVRSCGNTVDSVPKGLGRQPC